MHVFFQRTMREQKARCLQAVSSVFARDEDDEERLQARLLSMMLTMLIMIMFRHAEDDDACLQAVSSAHDVMMMMMVMMRTIMMWMMKHVMLVLSPTCGFCRPASRSQRRCHKVKIARSAFSLRRPHETSFLNVPTGHTMKTGRKYRFYLSIYRFIYP